jgi:hypothetical protein
MNFGFDGSDIEPTSIEKSDGKSPNKLAKDKGSSSSIFEKRTRVSELAAKKRPKRVREKDPIVVVPSASIPPATLVVPRLTVRLSSPKDPRSDSAGKRVSQSIFLIASAYVSQDA